MPSFPPTSPAPPSSGFVTLDTEVGQRTRVWDLPTRLFHWALALSVIALVVTGSAGVMEWHFRLGYAVLALLLFRIVWGFIGGRWSRFGAFVYSPGTLVAYLRGRGHPDHVIGHTPMGALSVFAVLAVLAVQVATGLVADDEIASSGPLVRFVSSATTSLATGWHKAQGKWLVIGLVGVHVLAVLYYVLVKRAQLVRPMISGDKRTGQAVAPSRDDAGSRLLALVVFALCATLAYWVASLRV
jgi:cytochrome b